MDYHTLHIRFLFAFLTDWYTLVVISEIPLMPLHCSSLRDFILYTVCFQI